MCKSSVAMQVPMLSRRSGGLHHLISVCSAATVFVVGNSVCGSFSNLVVECSLTGANTAIDKQSGQVRLELQHYSNVRADSVPLMS
ncbi:hypothetical protein IG631_10473 [Alternaria alternata]|nr:hypothetical protein IG631_10473 [Alternaria alternata]